MEKSNRLLTCLPWKLHNDMLTYFQLVTLPQSSKKTKQTIDAALNSTSSLRNSGQTKVWFIPGSDYMNLARFWDVFLSLCQILRCLTGEKLSWFLRLFDHTYQNGTLIVLTNAITHWNMMRVNLIECFDNYVMLLCDITTLPHNHIKKHIVRY